MPQSFKEKAHVKDNMLWQTMLLFVFCESSYI